MAGSGIPDDVRRFVLTSVPTVPFLEALLLMRGEPAEAWDSARVAARLYVSAAEAGTLLAQLHASALVERDGRDGSKYQYRPRDEALRRLIDALAAVYATNLVDVAELIHSKTGRKAQRFADAFKLRKDG